MNKVILISILISIYLVFSLFSFKIIDYNNYNNYNDNHYMHSDITLLRHRQSKNSSFWDTVINSGVCPLGKFGFIVLVLWTIILILMLIFYNGDNRKKVLLYLGIINLLFFFIYGILTYLMNWPLFVRCIPYLTLQLIVSILILIL